MSQPLARPTPDDWNGIRDLVVELKCKGRGVDFIMAATGLKRQAVQNILKSEFNVRLGNRQELIQNTASELLWMKNKLVNAYCDKGDRKDAELALKYQERICKLFGLDEPVKHTVTVEDLSEEDLYVELKRAGITTSIQPKTLPEPIEDAVVEEIEER